MFYRREVRDRSARYLQGLLAPVERKNGWQLAQALGEPDPQGVQQLLHAARWDADAVRDELLRFVAETFGDADGIFALDETGFVKKGTHSVGVQRQYSGTAGRVENCQVGVFLSYISPQSHTLLDRRPYLPQTWTADPARCRAAGVPADVGFATKPGLAWAMLQHALSQGVPRRWVVGDTVYGQAPTFRAPWETVVPEVPYVLAVLAVPATQPLWQEQAVVPGSRRPGAVQVTRRWHGGTAARIAAALPASAWQRIAVADGTTGPRVYDWAVVRIAPGEHGWPSQAEHWLLVRRSLADPTERAYYLSNAPIRTPLGTLARVAGWRWPIEQCFEEAKGETGLDQYEVRRYRQLVSAHHALPAGPRVSGGPAPATDTAAAPGRRGFPPQRSSPARGTSHPPRTWCR